MADLSSHSLVSSVRYGDLGSLIFDNFSELVSVLDLSSEFSRDYFTLTHKWIHACSLDILCSRMDSSKGLTSPCLCANMSFISYIYIAVPSDPGVFPSVQELTLALCLAQLCKVDDACDLWAFPAHTCGVLQWFLSSFFFIVNISKACSMWKFQMN